MDLKLPKYLQNRSLKEKQIIMEYRKQGFDWDECEHIAEYQLQLIDSKQ